MRTSLRGGWTYWSGELRFREKECKVLFGNNGNKGEFINTGFVEEDADIFGLLGGVDVQVTIVNDSSLELGLGHQEIKEDRVVGEKVINNVKNNSGKKAFVNN